VLFTDLFANLHVTHRGNYGIGTLHYTWPMSEHVSQASSMYTSACDCTD